MPIYEYLCKHCNRVFSFMAKSYEETQQKKPTCPKCGATDLKRRMSAFSVSGAIPKSEDSGGGEGADDNLDDPRVEREMNKLMHEAENIDENDPRQLGGLMRRMSDITGEEMDAEMEEAVRRLESGEDPEKIEEEMGEVLGDEDEPAPGGMSSSPTYDDGLYSL
ncbi:MAG: zinc ribbon domain-containing protein [Lentisphaeria bacterium]